jgi:hypothetical protein
MRPSVEVEIGMGGFAVHSDGSPVNIHVQEGEMALPFGLHGELMDAVRWFRKSFSLSGPSGQMMVSTYRKQQRGCWEAEPRAVIF